MTSTVTVGEGAASVFVAVDHCTPECLGLHAAQRGTRCEPPERSRGRRAAGPHPRGARPARQRHAQTAPVPDDRDQDRQARDDGRTWTQHRAWTDQDRAGIQRVTKDTPAPREPRQDRAKPDARTDGHRREYNAREAQPRDRRTRTDRDRDAIADVGMYRAVSYTDLSEQHYDGHPYAARRAVTRMVRAGLIEEHEATGPQGNPFTVLTATQRGRGRRPRGRDSQGRSRPGARAPHERRPYDVPRRPA